MMQIYIWDKIGELKWNTIPFPLCKFSVLDLLYSINRVLSLHTHTYQAKESNTEEHSANEEHEGREEACCGLPTGARHLPTKETCFIEHYVLLEGIIVLWVVSHGYPTPELPVNDGVCACVCVWVGLLCFLVVYIVWVYVYVCCALKFKYASLVL